MIKLVTVPDPVLTKVCEPVGEVNTQIHHLMDQMLRVMYEENGGGLAAPQVGVLKRVVVMDPRDEKTGEKTEPYFLINPKILKYSEETISYTEGCLSVPGVSCDMIRPESVEVYYVDRDGKEQTAWWNGYLSRCIQHEIDHLNGVIYLEHTSPALRNSLLRKSIAYQKSKASVI